MFIRVSGSSGTRLRRSWQVGSLPDRNIHFHPVDRFSAEAQRFTSVRREHAQKERCFANWHPPEAMDEIYGRAGVNVAQRVKDSLKMAGRHALVRLVVKTAERVVAFQLPHHTEKLDAGTNFPTQQRARRRDNSDVRESNRLAHGLAAADRRDQSNLRRWAQRIIPRAVFFIDRHAEAAQIGSGSEALKERARRLRRLAANLTLPEAELVGELRKGEQLHSHAAGAVARSERRRKRAAYPRKRKELRPWA